MSDENREWKIERDYQRMLPKDVYGSVSRPPI
jgi:hypothetical protein